VNVRDDGLGGWSSSGPISHLLTAGHTRASPTQHHPQRWDARARSRRDGLRHPLVRALALHGVPPPSRAGSHLESPLRPGRPVLTARTSLDAGGSVAYVRTDASPNEVLQHDRVNAPTVAPVKYLHKRGDPAPPRPWERPNRVSRSVACSPRAGFDAHGPNRACRPVLSATTTSGQGCACASSPRSPCTQVTPRTRCVGGCDRRGTGALPELHG
jgi:hypothetical protein